MMKKDKKDLTKNVFLRWNSLQKSAISHWNMPRKIELLNFFLILYRQKAYFKLN